MVNNSMEILEIRTLRGPNYWSGYWKKLIIMRLDIGEYEQQPTDTIEGFYSRLVETMPSLISHGCSYQEEGGFLRRVEEGTWAGHVIEHLALELQTLAGMDTGYGRTRETDDKGVYNVVFSYMEEAVGRFAGRSAVRLFLALAEGKPVKEIKADLATDIQEMREIREEVRFGPSTGSLGRGSREPEHSFYTTQRSIACSVGLRCLSKTYSGHHDGEY